MEITNKQETIIKIVCILILIILNILVYLNGKDLSCDKCQIEFHSKDLRGSFDYFVNISDLYNHYLNNSCFVEFSEGGFIIKNELK